MASLTDLTTSISAGYCASDAGPASKVITNEWESFTRRLTGLSLFASLALVLYLVRNFDHLPTVISAILRRVLHSASRNDVHIQVPMSKALAYQVDRWFTNTRYSKPLTLLYLTVVLIVVGWLSLYASGGASSYDSFWSAVAGAGVDWSFLSEQPQEEDLMVRMVAALLSVGGMLVTALMLGIVSDAISRKVDELAKGRSAVLEVDHTLILGWNDKIFCLLDQLCNANKSLGGAAIVILAQMEKDEMEAALEEHQIDLRGSSIICRSGNPLRPTHLHQVSVETCRSIIVLADNKDPDQSDADALRIVLCLMAVDEQSVADGNQGLQAHMVVEICDKDNEPLVQTVGEERVITVVSHDIIGRIMIQCARQPGLSNVLEDVIGFEGNEFYMKEWPQLVGCAFSEVVLCFENAVPLGVKQGENGLVILNPEPTYLVEEGDQIIVLAEDDDTYTVGPMADANPGVGPSMLEENPQPEKYLFCGWRRDMDDMIMVLDEFAEPGSELWLYSDVKLEERKGRLLQGGLDPDKDLRNLKLVYLDPCLYGSLVVRKKLEALDMLQYSAILILADEDASGHGIADADTRNLATLLLVRHLQLDRMRALQGLGPPPGSCRQSSTSLRTPRPEVALAETRRMLKQQFTDSIRAMRRGSSLPPPPSSTTTNTAHTLFTGTLDSRIPLSNTSAPLTSPPSAFDKLCDESVHAMLSNGPQGLDHSADSASTAQQGTAQQGTAGAGCTATKLPKPATPVKPAAVNGTGREGTEGQGDRSSSKAGKTKCSASRTSVTSAESSRLRYQANNQANNHANSQANNQANNDDGLTSMASVDSSTSADDVDLALGSCSDVSLPDETSPLLNSSRSHISSTDRYGTSNVARSSRATPLLKLDSKGREVGGADAARVFRPTDSSRALRHSESGKDGSMKSAGSAWYNNLQPEMRGTVVISEILDSKARQLIKRLKISEFVLSNELVSMVLAMVSENRHVNDILQELLRQEGNELYVQPPEHYLHPDETLSFYDLLARAYQRREIVIGYTLLGAERAVLNPPQKSVPNIELDTVQNVIVLALYDHYVNCPGLRTVRNPNQPRLDSKGR